MVEERSRAVRVAVAEPALAAPVVTAVRALGGPAGSTQAARRQLMRRVTAEVPEPRGGDRAARREALLHVLEMSRRRRRPGRG